MHTIASLGHTSWHGHRLIAPCALDEAASAVSTAAADVSADGELAALGSDYAETACDLPQASRTLAEAAEARLAQEARRTYLNPAWHEIAFHVEVRVGLRSRPHHSPEF